MGIAVLFRAVEWYYKPWLIPNGSQPCRFPCIWGIARVGPNDCGPLPGRWLWLLCLGTSLTSVTVPHTNNIPDNKIHGANMGLFWGQQDPGGAPCWPHELCYLGCAPWLILSMTPFRITGTPFIHFLSMLGVMEITGLSFYFRYSFLNSFLIDVTNSIPSQKTREISFTRHCVYRLTEMRIERVRINNSSLIRYANNRM